MRAKRFLLRYKEERKKVRRLQAQILELDDLFSVTQDMTSEKVQSSPKPDRIGEIIARKSDLKEELWEEIAKSMDIMEEIEGVINDVKDADLQLLLQSRYIRFMTWEKIAVQFDYSYRWVLILHGRALMEVEKIIDGV